MSKLFIPFTTVRNNALKLAHTMYTRDHFVPDIIYVVLRGGVYMGNAISEYYKAVGSKTLYAAVVTRSYTDILTKNTEVEVDGWTYNPDKLTAHSKILLVDDVYDSGDTIQTLVDIFKRKGIPRDNIKVIVHDYKYFTNKNTAGRHIPDYYCNSHIITKPEENIWIHYESHELAGLTQKEIQDYYLTEDTSLEFLASVLKLQDSKIPKDSVTQKDVT